MRIYGPGASDAKASLTSMIYFFKKIKETSKVIPTIYFAGVISEETLHYGIKKFLTEYKEFDGAVVGEPTKLEIGIAHKGCLRLRIKTMGRSAHGSNPKEGVNAIKFMAKIINKINSELIEKYKLKKHNILGNPTVNIGTIKGGTAFNVVPDNCSVEIDRRIILGENFDEILFEFDEILTLIKKEHPKIGAEIEDYIDYVPYLETDKRNRIVEIAIKTLNSSGFCTDVKGLSYSTDAGFLSEKGIPTIVLGPGNVNDCHKLDEFIELKQLEDSAMVYRNIALNFS